MKMRKNMIICGLIVITGTKEQLGAEKEQIEGIRDKNRQQRRGAHFLAPRRYKPSNSSSLPRKSQRRSATNPAPRRSLDEVGPYSREKARKRKEKAQLRNFDLGSIKKALGNTKKGREEQKTRKTTLKRNRLLETEAIRRSSSFGNVLSFIVFVILS